MNFLDGVPTESPTNTPEQLEHMVDYYLGRIGCHRRADYTPEKRKDLEKYFEEEITKLQRNIAQKEDSPYPALQTPAPTEEDANRTQWNPDAWIKYPS